MYLAIIINLYSCQIVGWVMDKRMKKDLILQAISKKSFGSRSRRR
ncbi:MAG: hypothetical protein ACK2TV_01630 [Anaerolineales bacterium]